jgi:hypothetical protein
MTVRKNGKALSGYLAVPHQQDDWGHRAAQKDPASHQKETQYQSDSL